MSNAYRFFCGGKNKCNSQYKQQMQTINASNDKWPGTRQGQQERNAQL